MAEADASRPCRRRLRALRVLALFAALGGGCALFASSDPFDPWRTHVEKLRGLEFDERVPLQWFDGERVAEVLAAELDAELTPAELAAFADAYAALGLLPPDYPIRERMIEMTAGEVAGLYTLSNRTMWVRGTADAGPLPEAPNPIVVHELVHALQHQHFEDTITLLRGLRHHEDVSLAVLAAIEGDALLTMFEGMGGPFERDVKSAELMRDAVLMDTALTTGRLSEYPRILQVSQLTFPYAYGAVEAARRYEAEGNRGLDALLRSPPLATVQLMYPDEPLREGVAFARLPDSLAERLPKECRLGHHTAVGALGMRVLLEDYDVPRDQLDALASGWRGDRFQHVVCGERWELVWLTLWRDEAAARAFGRAFDSIAERIADGRPLSGTPGSIVWGRSALVVTERSAPLARAILDGTELRHYTSLAAWVADDCFPEGCP